MGKWLGFCKCLERETPFFGTREEAKTTYGFFRMASPMRRSNLQISMSLPRATLMCPASEFKFSIHIGKCPCIVGRPHIDS